MCRPSWPRCARPEVGPSRVCRSRGGQRQPVGKKYIVNYVVDVVVIGIGILVHIFVVVVIGIGILDV